MASPGADRKWQLVLDPQTSEPKVFTVRNAGDAEEVMTAARAFLRDMMARGGCRSLVIAVHVEGPACDHEIAGAR